MALADRTLAEVLELVAAREPAPGGGSAAAWAGAIAAALTEMAAAFAVDADDAAATGDRAGELRARLLELADEDIDSYTPVLAALALERSDPDRPARVRAALSAAADVPLAIASAAAEVAELAAAAAQAGSRHLVGDATAAAVLAEASTRAAIRLAELNLNELRPDPRLDQAAALGDRAWAARMATLGLGEGGRP